MEAPCPVREEGNRASGQWLAAPRWNQGCTQKGDGPRQALPLPPRRHKGPLSRDGPRAPLRPLSRPLAPEPSVRGLAGISGLAVWPQLRSGLRLLWSSSPAVRTRRSGSTWCRNCAGSPAEPGARGPHRASLPSGQASDCVLISPLPSLPLHSG